MEKSFIIKTEDNILSIELNPRKPIIVTIGMTVLVVLYVFIAITISLIPDRSRLSSPDFGYVLGLAGLFIYSALYFLVARAFIRRLTQQEIITVNHSQLIITDRYLLGKTVRKYDLQHVTEIFFAGRENFTKHPLEGNYADIGFRGMEGVVQYQITDGNMLMTYGKRQIRFGRNIPSWDAEEIVEIIMKYTGKSLTPKYEPEASSVSSRYRGEM
jgi:hypothetical protein